mmetsp:Transcript_33888/g.32987  ORF Transcript_33888/g.32987 Transcript_33888/m.32987 type:complete len:100 (-) Transcript_33888:21-320(-)
MGNIMIYFFNGGHLPWMGLDGRSPKQKQDAIMEVKRNTDMEDLCAHCPPEMLKYMRYCRNMEFDQNPDYNFIQKLFEDAFRRIETRHVEELEFDWNIRK